MTSKILLTEQSKDIELLTETVDGKKRLKIEGIFAQSEVINGNKRFYKRDILEESMDAYVRDFVSKKRAIGEWQHPDYPLPNAEQGAILIEELKWDGDNLYGKAVVIEGLPKGQIVKGLLEAGFAVGVSTRALGTITEKQGIKYVDKGLYTTAIDCVDMPSGPDCYVNPLMESIQESIWTETNGIYIRENKINLDESVVLQKIEDYIKSIRNKKR